MIFVGIATILIICAIICYQYIPYKPKHSFSFKEANDLVGLPIITFYSNKQKLHFLLDTGADHSAFSNKYLNLVEHKMLDGQGTLTDAGGHTVNVGVAYMRLYYGNRPFDSYFQIVDMTPISKAIGLTVKGQEIEILGVIGCDFLAKYEYILDFSKMIAYSVK